MSEAQHQLDNRRLPDGWNLAKLGDLIAEAKAGFACGLRNDTGVIQLRMNNVNTRGNFVWDEFIRVPADEAEISQYRLLSGDVLFNNTNSTELVGKTALFCSHSEPVVYSNHFTRIRTRQDRLDATYLSFWLNGEWQRGTFGRICNRWIGQSAVKAEKLCALTIPLPSLAEQKRIAGILKEQLAAVERARAAAEGQLAAAKAIPGACLCKVFSDASQAKGTQRQLGDVCQLLPSKSIATAGDAEVRAITTACLTESGFDPSGIKTARMKSSDAEVCVVASNEVLIARSNTAELVGRAALFPGEPKGTVASDLTIRICAGETVEPKFLATYLSYLYVTGFWREKAGGASGSMKKITRSQVCSLPIPVLDIGEQCAIMARVSEQLAAAAQLRVTIGEQLAAISRMPAALLSTAFQGRL